MSQHVAKLVSVNVGLPREISWRGRTVFTGIWKEPVDGPRTVRRLNVDGDGQGDLNGHGGEQRAVYVYQLDSYRYWQREMQRDDFTFGQFGENFTIDGLGDDEVCVGDRYRIGSALFEVTQPRVTCYRVGIRMDEPRMAALLVAHGRPGFYFRVSGGGRSPRRRRRREDRHRARSDDGRRHQRVAVPRRSSRRRPTPARAAHPGAEPGLAGIDPGAPRRGDAACSPLRRKRRIDRARDHRRRGRDFGRCGSPPSTPRAPTSSRSSWNPRTVGRCPAPGRASSSRSSCGRIRARRRSCAAIRCPARRAVPATGSA